MILNRYLVKMKFGYKVFRWFNNLDGKSGNKKSPEKTTSKNDLEDKCHEQIDIVPKSLEGLAKKGITKKNKLKLYFLFMGNCQEDVNAFKKILQENWGYYNLQSKKIENIYMVSGYTDPFPMCTSSIQPWVREMCQISLAQNLDFLGWGINFREN